MRERKQPEAHVAVLMLNFKQMTQALFTLWDNKTTTTAAATNLYEQRKAAKIYLVSFIYIPDGDNWVLFTH